MRVTGANGTGSEIGCDVVHKGGGSLVPVLSVMSYRRGRGNCRVQDAGSIRLSQTPENLILPLLIRAIGKHCWSSFRYHIEDSPKACVRPDRLALHTNQVGKGGRPYIEHFERVARILKIRWSLASAMRSMSLTKVRLYVLDTRPSPELPPPGECRSVLKSRSTPTSWRTAPMSGRVPENQHRNMQ